MAEKTEIFSSPSSPPPSFYMVDKTGKLSSPSLPSSPPPSYYMGEKTEKYSSPSSPPPSFYRKYIISYINEQVELDSRSEKRVLLLESAGKESCCIFRVPKSFAEMNPEAYKPKVVSIGPYHHGRKHLEMIQQHKLRFLHLFLRTASVDRDVLFNAVVDWEDEIRKSYSEGLEGRYMERHETLE